MFQRLINPHKPYQKYQGPPIVVRYSKTRKTDRNAAVNQTTKYVQGCNNRLQKFYGQSWFRVLDHVTQPAPAIANNSTAK